MISWVLLTWNSAKEIRNVLESMKSVGAVDEIIAVDSYSTDNTAEILKEYGARIFQKPFNNSFGELRNFAIEQAKNDWILVLDTDECLTDETKSLLAELAQDTDYDCYIFRRRNYLDNVLQQDQDYHYRLFQKYCRYEGRMHEQLSGYFRCGRLEHAEVIHKKSREKQNRQTERYIQIEKEIKEREDRIRNIAVVGIGYQGQKHAKELADIGMNVITCDNVKEAKFSNYREIENVSGVVVATNNASHNEIGRFFVEKNVPILMEKPLTIDYVSSRDLLALAKENEVPLLTGSVFMFNNALKKAREISTKLGKIEFIKCNWKSRMKPWAETDILLDLAPHAYDIIRLFGILPPPGVATVIDDYHWKMFAKTDDGTKMEICVSWIEGPKERVVKVFCEHGYIVLDAFNQAMWVYRNDKLVASVVPPHHIFDKSDLSCSFSPNNTIKDMLLEFVRQIDRGPDYTYAQWAVDFLKWRGDMHLMRVRNE